MHEMFAGERMQAFRRRLIEEERSAGTVEKYLRDVRAVAQWLGERPPGKEAAAGWKEALLQAGYRPVTINSMLSALNRFFHFAGHADWRLRFLRVQRRAFRDPERELDRADYLRLLETAERQGRHRLRLVLETLCATGIRVSELRYITVEAVKHGRAEIALKGKIRTILLPDKLCRKLMRYLRAQKITSGAIFRTRGGGELSREQIWREMKSLCREAGVAPSKVFPHNLRHLFATTFYQTYKDIVRLADLLGHASIDTTRIYLVTTGAEHARQLERLRLIS